MTTSTAIRRSLRYGISGALLLLLVVPLPWAKLVAYRIGLYGTGEAGGVAVSVRGVLFTVLVKPTSTTGPAYKDMFTFDSIDVRSPSGWSQAERLLLVVHLVDGEVFGALADKCREPLLRFDWGSACEIKAPQQSTSPGDRDDDFGLYVVQPANVILRARSRTALNEIRDLRRL